MLSPALYIDPEQVLWNTIDGHVIVLQMSSGVFFWLNGTGSVIWTRIAQGMSTQDILAELGTRYGVAAAELEKDMSAFSGDAMAKGLLVAEKPARPAVSAEEPAIHFPASYEKPVIREHAGVFTDVYAY